MAKTKAKIICDIEIDGLSKKDAKDYIEFILESMDKIKAKKYKIIYDI